MLSRFLEDFPLGSFLSPLFAPPTTSSSKNRAHPPPDHPLLPALPVAQRLLVGPPSSPPFNKRTPCSTSFADAADIGTAAAPSTDTPPTPDALAAQEEGGSAAPSDGLEGPSRGGPEVEGADPEDEAAEAEKQGVKAPFRSRKDSGKVTFEHVAPKKALVLGWQPLSQQAPFGSFKQRMKALEKEKEEDGDPFASRIWSGGLQQ